MPWCLSQCDYYYTASVIHILLCITHTQFVTVQRHCFANHLSLYHIVSIQVLHCCLPPSTPDLLPTAELWFNPVLLSNCSAPVMFHMLSFCGNVKTSLTICQRALIHIGLDRKLVSSESAGWKLTCMGSTYAKCPHLCRSMKGLSPCPSLFSSPVCQWKIVPKLFFVAVICFIFVRVNFNSK